MDNVILLADKQSNSWTFSERVKEYIVEKIETKVDLAEVSITYFNNGELNMYVEGNVRKKDVYFIHDATKDPQKWWVELLLLKDLLQRASARSVSFVLPNMLYSRQDRKDRPHVPISASALADSISPGLERIITMDLHAPQIQGFYPADTPLDNLYSSPEAIRYLRENHLEDLDDLAIVSPDAGGAHRVEAFLKRLEESQEDQSKRQKYSTVLISKVRKNAGEIQNMRLVGDVKDKNILIVDDMIDTGGTLLSAAELLKVNGARKLMCYATHGFFTKGAEEICNIFDAVMVTNTHNQKKYEGLEVIDVSPIFAEAIYRAQEGRSISKLFE